MQEPLAAAEDPERKISSAQSTSLAELARLFLKLGIVAFGGPPAHIAMMEDEVVSRRQWLTREQFLDFLGATNLIPGPNSTEMAIHIGRVRAGWPGLLVAGASFILPSAVMVTALAWAYVRFGSLPEVTGIMYGVKPIVIALIVQAVFKLAKTAVKSTWLAAVGALAELATALGVDQLAVLAGGGLLTRNYLLAALGEAIVVCSNFSYRRNCFDQHCCRIQRCFTLQHDCALSCVSENWRNPFWRRLCFSGADSIQPGRPSRLDQ